MIYKQIDYLQYSAPPTAMPDRADRVVSKAPSRMRFYTHCDTFESGGYRHHGNPNTDKPLYIYPGQALQNLTDTLPMRDIIQTVIDADGCVSRIDFAVTITGDDDNYIPMDEFCRMVADGRVSGSHIERGGAMSYHELIKNRDETVYIGSWRHRARHGIFRAYRWDLAHNPDSPLPIVRYELEEKRDKAHRAARLYADGYQIGRLIQQRINIDSERWRAIMGSAESIDMRYRDDNATEEVSTWHWLTTKVAPALARAIVDDMVNERGLGNYDMFTEIVSKRIERELRERGKLTN